MTDEHVKSLHDGIVGHFGMNHSKLLGFLYRLAEMAALNNMCVFPIEPRDEEIDALELAIFHENNKGYNPADIYFNTEDANTAKDVAMEINDKIFGIDHFRAKQIVEQSLYNKRQGDKEMFDKALLKVISSMPAEKLIQIPGVYEAVSESCNNMALDILERYRANPAMNNLEIKYTTREILEIVLADLKSLKEATATGTSHKALDKIRNQVQQSIDLADGHLENMQNMIDGRPIQ